MKPLQIGLLGFDEVMALDLVGPIDAFKSASIEESSCYNTIVIGLSDQPFVSESGIVFQPQKSLANAPALDTLIIPGGWGLRVPKIRETIVEWIHACAQSTRRIAAVSTGVYALAEAGLLNGRRVATHWRHAQEVAASFPQLIVDPHALYLSDGKFYTGAGITAGIDLSLALIEEDFGPQVALTVARELVVYLKRSGGQEQFSEPLKFQTQSRDRFSDLAAWIEGHLREDLHGKALAERACLSERHFIRRFKMVFSTTPAAFVEEVRLRQARGRLALPDQTVETVAYSVGFNSADAFRRAFERCYGLQPSRYRQQVLVNGKSPRLKPMAHVQKRSELTRGRTLRATPLA